MDGWVGGRMDAWAEDQMSECMNDGQGGMHKQANKRTVEGTNLRLLEDAWLSMLRTMR